MKLRLNLIDAIRISDNRLVYIKRVHARRNEEQIATFFSKDSLRQDPRNHCVPVLDLIPDDCDENISYIVMPFLRLIDDPPFRHINDIVEFIDQILEVSWIDCARSLFLA